MRAVVRAAAREGDRPAARLSCGSSTIAEIVGNAAAARTSTSCGRTSATPRACCARAPGFAITAVLIVALGIGATTAAFSVTDFVLLRPLPFPEPDRLVKVWETTPGYGRMELSPANYRDWKAAATVVRVDGDVPRRPASS